MFIITLTCEEARRAEQRSILGFVMVHIWCSHLIVKQLRNKVKSLALASSQSSHDHNQRQLIASWVGKIPMIKCLQQSQLNTPLKLCFISPILVGWQHPHFLILHHQSQYINMENIGAQRRKLLLIILLNYFDFSCTCTYTWPRGPPNLFCRSPSSEYGLQNTWPRGPPKLRAQKNLLHFSMTKGIYD